MKVEESFTVERPRDQVWAFIQQIERVADCIPGLDRISMTDDDTYDVQITQSLGVFKVTFDAKMRITSRQEGRELSFTATGQSIRGAAGNLRSMTVVRLEDNTHSPGTTNVIVEADVVLGGMLGAVGQKLIAKQATKIAKQFAKNLESDLQMAEK